MVFSSLLFLFGFLPVFFGLYYLVPARLKNAIALIASCVFYSWGAANVFGIVLVGLALDYLLANKIARIQPDSPRAVSQRKWLLALSIAANVGALAYYKYSGFFVEQVNLVLGAFSARPLKLASVVLPIGISFFTFHKLSYVVDVYRGVSPPARTFATFSLYVLFFPQLIAGPIIRYHDVAEQLERRDHPLSSVAYGAFRFCIGLGKKVLIANQLALTADLVFGKAPVMLSCSLAWLGVLCYTFQIYFDFSGYSDMALGLGHMLGIRFKENFDCPYRSLSITEFWRRWHISLSSWMKEYLYVPLGGNRAGAARTYLNLWIVFLLSGLWHGANWTFVIWGMYHGTWLVTERLFWLRIAERLPKLVRAASSFVIVAIGWVFFRAPTLGYAAKLIGRMLGASAYHPDPATPLLAELITNRALVALCVAAVLSFAPLFELGAAVSRHFEAPQAGAAAAGLRYVGAFLCLFFACAALANSSYNPFIYFRF
jgi:alginate O-acetyltransferase complex protein AlgI